jgi:predicted ferric reductase
VVSGAAFGAEGWESTPAGSALPPQWREGLAVATRAAWIGAFAVTLLFVLWYRLLVPAVRSHRHDLRVAEVLAVGPGVIRMALSGRRLDRLHLVGGQFAQFRFGVSGLRWQAHPYSFSGLRDRARVYLTIGGGGDHALALAELPIGTRVFFEGPYGALTAAAAVERPDGVRLVLIVVGGLGITPVCSLLRDLPPEARPVIIYRVREEGHALYLDELRRLAAARSGEVHVLAGTRDVHPLSPRHVEEWVPDLGSRHVYVCGSRGFVKEVSAAVHDLGVPRDRVTTEAFAW